MDPGGDLAYASPEMPVYFAFGSNMDSSQMARRVPAARPLGIGRLPDYRFVCNKIGRDGTAKANVEPSAGNEVWGVLYEMTEDALVQLDRFEQGYDREPRDVWDPAGTRWEIQLYVSVRTDTTLVPTTAYRDRMARGAREHGLPRACVDRLERLPSADDGPDGRT